MLEEFYPVKSDQQNEDILCDAKTYQSLYQHSMNDPVAFWDKQGERLDWIRRYTPDAVMDYSFDKKNVGIRWYHDGILNVCYNCVDRHVKDKAGQTAIIWEGDDPQNSRHITYLELYHEVNKFANVLKEMGVKRGDRVTIYMPMIPEAAYAMLACARIGAVHSVVFAGFSANALQGRIDDCKSDYVITADEGIRGGKAIALKTIVDEALKKSRPIKKTLVVKNSGGAVNMQKERDIWYHDYYDIVEDECPPTEMNAEDPLFILYTSGSTGKPKGVMHTSGGYLVYASMTHQYAFDYREGEIYWCTADVGWITGHSYIIYGPLANGATTLMFEGVPSYPDFNRLWQICDKHQVNIFYTAPTAIRALMAEGDEFLADTERYSLRLLGTVGEPINPEAWRWYYENVGHSRCPIIDTWWQTETGGFMITALPGAIGLKPGSATLPFFGAKPVLLDEQKNIIEGEGEGALVLAQSWPGQMRTVFGDHQRFIDTYFTQYPGYYFTGDGAKRDKDGYYWITGRMDDVINVSGHRLGTAEIESALVLHEDVAEAAVVGYPHDVKGSGIYAFVTLIHGYEHEPTDALREELIRWVADHIGKIAKPEKLQWAPSLPKTRSGKIMRRILRKIAHDDLENMGDTSTLADPTVVQDLIDNRII